MREFARSIVETVRHPLLVLDGGLRVAAANLPFYRAFVAAPADTLGRPLYDLAPGLWDPPGLRGLRGPLEQVILHDGYLSGLGLEADLPGAGRRHLLFSARRVARDEDGTPMVLLAIEDDTDRRKARDDLRRLNAELENRVAARTAELEAANRGLTAANRELEAFSYSVSHDLRAPLMAVDRFGKELLERYADRLDDTGRHYLSRVRAGTQRMGQLIDDLLALAGVTRAGMAIGRVDLSALAEEVAADLRQREPGRTVAFAAEPGLVAWADPRLVRVALENLLGNAWKFTAKKAEAAVAFGRTRAGGRPAFFVRDDGAGFDPAFAGRLFGAFQRLHPDREFPGTGVGLATVLRVVRRHGGEAWAEGAVGRGATFYFTLPGPEDAARPRR